jgi:hypothetical protein
MTDKYQPLDRRIFESLKSWARARFDCVSIQNPGEALTLIDAIAVLLDVWEAIPQDEILDAWSELDLETSSIE